MLGVDEYSGVEAKPYSSMNEVMATKRKKRDNKRRFSDDQIKSLELMFENETRLEPQKKLQLAKELGLQPRQVAIWFQNRRARWKSKQLERDYSILQASYNNLASRFESLKKEKQALQIKVQQLKERIEQPVIGNQHSGESMGMNSADLESENGETARSESEVQPSISMGLSENVLGVQSDDDSTMMADYFGLEDETSLVNMVGPTDANLTSAEDWSSFEPGLFDHSGGGYQWLDFWS